MTNKEFIDWIKGYVDGVHPYSASPKQWQHLKEKVKSINKGSERYEVDSTYWTTNIS
jgi:hypothetical protein